MINVAVVDDHPLFRSGVIQILQMAHHLEVVDQGASVADAIRISRICRPDVMILDMNLPDPCDGITAVEAILAEAPAMRILILSVVADREIVREAMKRGALGYVLKGIGGPEFVDAVRAVYRGEGYVTPTLAACLFARVHAPEQAVVSDGAVPLHLSAREDQVLYLIRKGLSNKEIAKNINLTEKTVKHYATNLFQKMHVRNRTEAAVFAGQLQAK